MSDIDQEQKRRAMEMALKAAEAAADAAYDQGFQNGFNAGTTVGFVQAVNALKPALSDGLRNGSSECGKAMQNLQNMGALPTDDKD